jgi:plastocyanin
VAAAIGSVLLTLVVGVSGAWAASKIIITREHNEPETLTVKAGEDVEWVNNSGGTAHVWFGDNDAIRFYIGGIGMGKGSSVMKFDKPGNYPYKVHITGQSHDHAGSVVVK